MIIPHVHVPYHMIEDYLQFIKENHINLEIYFSAHSIDQLNDTDIIKLKERLNPKTAF